MVFSLMFSKKTWRSQKTPYKMRRLCFVLQKITKLRGSLDLKQSSIFEKSNKKTTGSLSAFFSRKAKGFSLFWKNFKTNEIQRVLLILLFSKKTTKSRGFSKTMGVFCFQTKQSQATKSFCLKTKTWFCSVVLSLAARSVSYLFFLAIVSFFFLEKRLKKIMMVSVKLAGNGNRTHNWDR